MYNRSASSQAHARTREEILRPFDGFMLVDPGLLYVPLGRPDSPGDVPGHPRRFANLVGMARKG